MKKGKLILYIILIILLAGAFALVLCSKYFAVPKEAYAAENAADTSTISNPQELEGISNISTGQSGNIEPSQSLFFGLKVESAQQGLGRVTLTLEELINPGETYKLEISYITNSKRYWTSTSNATVRIAFLNDTTVDNETTITTNSAGITENTLTVNVSQNVNNIQLDYFYNQNGVAPAGEYWINILNFNLYNSSNTALVKYTSYLYEYLKGQFDNATSSGYENGMNDGEILYRNNPFNGASLIDVVTEQENHKITGVGLNILSNGVSFSSINRAADVYFTDNGIDNRRFTVTFKTLPFIFEQNRILISQKMGFYSLYFKDTENKWYQIQESNDSDSNGWYFLTSPDQNAYGKQITEIEITFANNDYVGTLYVGKTAAQDSAYNEGYNKGYNSGYTNGLAESIGSLTGWDAVKNGISGIFEAMNIKIFGLFSLGDIVGIVIVFSVVLFFLKIVRG